MTAAGRSFALLLAFVVGDVLRVRRSHVEQAMERAAIAAPRKAARAMYFSLALAFTEFISMALGRRRVVHLPHEILSHLRERGRGAVVATAHTGNWDVTACALAREVPFTVVTKRLSVRFLDWLWQGIRRRQGVHLVHAGGAARGVAAALGRGGLVAMIIDQAPERARAVLAVRFLGADAFVDLAPALAAMRARAPLVAAFAVRRDDGSHGIDVARVIDPPERPSRAWAVHAMMEATRALEEFVRAHPDQWLWMHRRWKPLPVPQSVLPGLGPAAIPEP